MAQDLRSDSKKVSGALSKVPNSRTALNMTVDMNKTRRPRTTPADLDPIRSTETAKQRTGETTSPQSGNDGRNYNG